MSRKKLAVVRDEEMEGLCGVSIESASAFYDDDSGSLAVVGELVASRGVLEDEYREVHVVIHDDDGDVVGRDFSNWGRFGLRQSFELRFDESENLYGTPASVRVFPASPFSASASVRDSESAGLPGNPNCGQDLSFELEPAIVDHERLAYIAECFSPERWPTQVKSFRTAVSLTFVSDDLHEVARLLNVQPSCLSQDAPMMSLEGDLRADADLNGQIASLLSRTTDDLAAWRELAEEHSAGLTLDITTSGWDCWSLVSDLVLALGERSLGLGGQVSTECD